MATVFLLLGGNQGEREYYLAAAARQIGTQVGPVIQKSKIYLTAAWGLTDQPAFLNQLLLVSTDLLPVELLHRLNNIEATLGRVRKIKWGARVIDIDILYYDQLVLNLPQLVIPHPRLQDRRFALLPLAEVAPDFVHPVLHKTNLTLLQNCTDNLPVTIYDKK